MHRMLWGWMGRLGLVSLIVDVCCVMSFVALLVMWSVVWNAYDMCDRWWRVYAVQTGELPGGDDKCVSAELCGGVS